MSEENIRYGFVYIWFDRKHKRYYIGSHWGTEDDGYICSSNWMRDAYRRRPTDFKPRRTLVRIYTNKKDLLIEEFRWLQMIKPEEISPNTDKPRYYNLHIKFQNHWSADEQKAKTVGQKISAKVKGQKWTTEQREKFSEVQRNRVRTDAERQKRSESMKKSWENASEERRQKTKQMMIERHQNGWSLSDESRALIGLKNREHQRKNGSPRKGMKATEETKQKMSKALKGVPKKPRTEEHRKNLSLSQKGRVMTDEHRHKLSIAAKKRFERLDHPFKSPHK